jgi:hypothetical protein
VPIPEILRISSILADFKGDDAIAVDKSSPRPTWSQFTKLG